MVRLSCSQNTQDGYTLMETVTAIFVLSIIMYSFTLGASTVFKHAGTHWQTFRSLNLRFSLHNVFTGTMSRISPPFWEQHNIEISPSGITASIPYLDGTHNSILLLDLQDGRLIISEETIERRRALFQIEGMQNASFAPAVNSITGRIDGIILETTLKSSSSKGLKEKVQVTGYFASRTARPEGNAR